MLARWKDQRLMVRAVLFVVALLILPSLLIFWIASQQASLAIQEQTGKALSELNRQALSTLDSRLEAVDDAMVTILAKAEVQAWSAAETLTLKERVDRYMETERLLRETSGAVKYSLFVFTERPEAYAFAPATDISPSGVFFARAPEERDWLQAAVGRGGGGAVQLIDAFGFHPKPTRTVAFTRAVADLSRGTGRTFAVLVATDIDSVLQGELSSVALPAATREYLVDPGGKALAGSLPIASPFAVPASGKTLLERILVSGDRMYVYNDSPTYGNRLVYDIPLESLVGSHREVQRSIQIATVGYFAALSVLLAYFGKSILRPMSRLARLTRAYEPGTTLGGLPEMKRPDEIGFLFRAFHSMTDRLNGLIKDKYEMELKQKESELALLHSQITPHLLYNTLDSIYWYGIRGGVPEVAGMVRDLSTVLRIGLSKGKEIISLKEELHHAEAYLHLQEKRYNHSFRFHLRADDGAAELGVPKVVIQPLVENSILHGVGKMDGEGEIWIDIRTDGTDVWIRVEDNGFRPVPLDRMQALLAGTADADQGFGIRNVHKRVQLRYGEAYGLSYSLREGGGTVATLRLPAVPAASASSAASAAPAAPAASDKTST